MIATVVHVITLLELGGAQEITLHTLRHLDRRRFRVHLATGTGALLDAEAAAIPDLSLHWIPDLVREVRPARDLRAFVALRKLFREIRRSDRSPVIVHTHSSKAGILGRLAAAAAGVDVRVHSIHGFAFHPRQRPAVRRAYQLMEQIAAPLTHAYTGDSAANLEQARALGLLRGDRPSLVLAPGIDAAEYRSKERAGAVFRRRLGVPAEAPIVGMLACLKPQKSPVDFVRTAARIHSRHRDAHFLLAGDGELRTAVESEIASAGLGERFHLLGWQRDVPSFLAACDVIGLTSLHEGLPRALLQAMAAGKPIVASRVDGVPEIVVDGRNGFLVEPRDVDTFAARIDALLDSPELRRTLGAESAAMVEPYEAMAGLGRLQALYETLLTR